MNNLTKTNNTEKISVRYLAVKIINRIEQTDAYLDKLLDNELKSADLSSLDKALLFEIVHGVIRWMIKLDWHLSNFYKGNFSKIVPNMKNNLRVALYQLLYLDKIPDYAAINEAVEFIKIKQGQKSADLTNAILRNILRNKDKLSYPDSKEDLIQYLSVFYSHPIWLVKRWITQYGTNFTEELLMSNNERPKIQIRINKLKTTKEELLEKLDEVELKYSETKYFDNFIELKNLTNISDWKYFKEGYFNIQDESTAISCKLLNPKENDRVLDMCSAPGGKTAILAELMNNQGEIIALDQYESRIKILDANLLRLGVQNVKSIVIDNLIYEDEKLFDKILIDAPCTGLGTLTKKPDIKLKRNLTDIIKLKELQMQILTKAASLLKLGGEMVYSTCSIDQDENINIIKSFLEKNKNFELIKPDSIFTNIILSDSEVVQTFPNMHKIDGAFAAKLKKIYN